MRGDVVGRAGPPLAERTGRPNGPRLAERGPYALAADVRLDNRDDLRRALGEPGDDGALLLAAYERWGIGLLDRVEGAFSFALWDGRAGRLHVARDAMGLRPLYRARVGDAWAFGSNLPTVRSLVPFRLNTEAAADFLTGRLDHPTLTFADGVERVPPAHVLTVTDGGGGHERRFWSVDPSVRLPDDDAVVERAFREAFDRSVLSRLDDATGAFLSGGLDSSSIVTTVRALRPTPPLPTFTFVYDERTAHETRYAEAVAEGGGLVPRYVQGESVSILGTLDDDLATVGEPFLTPNLFLAHHMYAEVARAGLGAVLDGFGGDSVVAHGEQRLTELALGLRAPSFAREARAVARGSRRPRRMALRLVRDYVAAPLVGPLRRPDAPVHFAAPDLARSPAGRGGPYRSVRASHVADLSSPISARAVEVAHTVGAGAGVDVRFPFLDRRVVEVCLAVPSAQRLRDGRTRSFLRRSMAGRLPPLVAERRGKGLVGNNFKDALFDRDADALRRLVYDDAPAAAGVLDLDALRRAYEEAQGVPHTRATVALPLWRAVTFARWMATLDRSAPRAASGVALPSPPASAGVFST